MKELHRYNDGSILKLMTARELISIPIWKGQRILDQAHAAAIKSAVAMKAHSLDSGYSIVKYNEETADGKLIESSYLIDGQHRASVIRDYYASTMCEADFNVTVSEKIVDSETDAIEYFNKINNVKVQQWKIDPNLLINSYISALEKSFNTNKKCLLIRPGATARPYLSSEALREAFVASKHFLRGGDSIAMFVQSVEEYNKQALNKFSIDLTQVSVKDEKLKERAIKANFALAYDTRLGWVRGAVLASASASATATV